MTIFFIFSPFFLASSDEKKLKGSKGIQIFPLEPPYWILLENPFHDSPRSSMSNFRVFYGEDKDILRYQKSSPWSTAKSNLKSISKALLLLEVYAIRQNLSHEGRNDCPFGLYMLLRF